MAQSCGRYEGLMDSCICKSRQLVVIKVHPTCIMDEGVLDRLVAMAGEQHLRVHGSTAANAHVLLLYYEVWVDYCWTWACR